jgi:hypothetical protein
MLRRLESDGSDEGQVRFALIRRGLETVRGVPGESIDGAMTLRTSAEHPEGFTHLLLTEHHAARPGSVDRSVEGLALFPVAIVSGRGGGGRESNPPEAQRASRRC